MKKTLLFLFVSCISSLSNGQTLLASHDLELKKPSEHHQALSFSNKKTNEVFVVASDKEHTTALHYNSAIFFKDSLKSKTPDKKTRWLSGYSFDENNNPIVYWASEDYKKIRSSTFDFKTRKVAEKEYNFPFKDEILLNVFSENNSFYVFSMVEEKEQLKLYVFEKDSVFERTIDLPDMKWYDGKNRPLKLDQLLERYPLEKMETNALNPLFYCTRKSKYYITDDQLILTFDHNPSETHTVAVSLTDFTIIEKKIPQPVLEKATGETNSFYHEGRLYQLKSNGQALVFVVKDYASGNTLHLSRTDKESGIAFKNSPLFIQTGNQRPRELKNTSKFLSRLDGTQTGISVYRHHSDYLVTIGGQRNAASTGDVLLGITFGAAGVYTGSGVDVGAFFDSDNTQLVYFETHLDQHANYLNKVQEPLAGDLISQFLYENKQATLGNSFPFKDHYIRGYYDKKAKKYVLRKFEDF